MDTIGDIGAGHTLGRYELLIPIASGGMASVWAARLKGTRGFQKIVAVKLMLAELVDDVNFEQMFLDEAALASQIKHPNVVEIIDLGEQEGVLYQVMEWVDGEPLHQLIRLYRDRDGIPHHLAVRIGAQAAGGLHTAHELRDQTGQLVGLVHRDVTPQNLLVGYDGNVKVVDFGVAKAASNSQQTVVGQMKGKAPYMAPEQAMGEPVDRRTDIFALGIVLYQLTTGKHPFRQDNDLATLKRIVDKNPAIPPSLVVPGYPSDLEAIVVKALAKDKNARFATMAEVMRALEALTPGGKRASAEDVAEFVRTELGARGERRRQAIREALRVADERGKGGETTIGTQRRLARPIDDAPGSHPGSSPSATSQPFSSSNLFTPPSGASPVVPPSNPGRAIPPATPTNPGYPAPPPPPRPTDTPFAIVANEPVADPFDLPAFAASAAPQPITMPAAFPGQPPPAAHAPGVAAPASEGRLADPVSTAAAATGAAFAPTPVGPTPAPGPIGAEPPARAPVVATPTPGPVAVAVPQPARAPMTSRPPPPRSALDDELERLAQADVRPRDNRSVVGALVVACVIAVVAVALFLAGGPSDAPAPTPTPLGSSR